MGAGLRFHKALPSIEDLEHVQRALPGQHLIWGPLQLGLGKQWGQPPHLPQNVLLTDGLPDLCSPLGR